MRSLLFSSVLILASSCALDDQSHWITGQGAADLETADSFADSRVAATLLAERRARDEVLAQVILQETADGRTIEEIATTDPHYRSRVFDVVRNAKMEARDFDDAGGVKVKVALDPAEVESQLNVPTYRPMEMIEVKTDKE